MCQVGLHQGSISDTGYLHPDFLGVSIPEAVHYGEFMCLTISDSTRKAEWIEYHLGCLCDEKTLD